MWRPRGYVLPSGYAAPYLAAQGSSSCGPYVEEHLLLPRSLAATVILLLFFLFFFQEKIPFLPKYDNGATTSSAYLSGVLHCYASSVTAQSLYLEGGSLSPAEPRQQLQCGGKSPQNQWWASGGRWAGCGQVIGGHCSGHRAPSKRCIPSASRQALPGQMLQPTAERLPAAERTVCCCADRSCERRPVCKLWHFGTESKYLLPKST